MHLTKLAIPKPQLAKFASVRGLSQRLTTNYLVHSILAETFSGCPSPFVAQDKGRLLRVLFYSDDGKDALVSRAKLSATPEAYEAVRWSEIASKPLPDPLPSGLNLAFETRACPVIRKSSASSGENEKGQTRTWDAGDELDAFLSKAWSTDQEWTREEAYSDWIRNQFDVRGGAEVQSVSMTSFTLA